AGSPAATTPSRRARRGAGDDRRAGSARIPRLLRDVRRRRRGVARRAPRHLRAAARAGRTGRRADLRVVGGHADASDACGGRGRSGAPKRPGVAARGRAAIGSVGAVTIAVALLALLGATLGALKLHGDEEVRRAESTYPPRGQLVEVEGIRLHYLRQG